MQIIGVDLQARQQTIAMLNTENGEKDALDTAGVVRDGCRSLSMEFARDTNAVRDSSEGLIFMRQSSL